ncbi:MAG TPA: fibronectin type III-like domain-contianing protein [Microlunatus sp.]
MTAATGYHDIVVRVSVTVTNTGPRSGVAVPPQLYLGRPVSAVTRPPQELRGFDRVELQPGAAHTVEFGLTRRELSHWHTVTHDWQVEPGPLEIAVGASSRDLPLTATVDLIAPRLPQPLTASTTNGAWLADPDAGPDVLTALGVRRPVRDRQPEPVLGGLPGRPASA